VGSILLEILREVDDIDCLEGALLHTDAASFNGDIEKSSELQQETLSKPTTKRLTDTEWL